MGRKGLRTLRVEASGLARASLCSPITPMLDDVMACTRAAISSFTASPVDFIEMCVICGPGLASRRPCASCFRPIALHWFS